MTEHAADEAERRRAAALAAGPGKVPRKAVVIAAACVAVLALGGAALDHLFPGPVGAAAVASTPGQYPPPFATSPSSEPAGGANNGQIRASIGALMGLQALKPVAAPGFSLTDQHGRRLDLSDLRGKVVVLSFFGSACNDICPVLGAELDQAYAGLGRRASRVVFVTVNTDPLELAASSAEAVGRSGLGAVPAWHFLSGPLSELDAVWRSYGVSIEVQRTTRTVSHNDVLYLIDPTGKLRYRATPFANESASGVFSLDRRTETSWAVGLEDQLRLMMGEA